MSTSATILRMPAVKAKTGIAGSTLYKLISEGKFPAPIKLGPRSSGWLETEVAAWIEARVRESRGGAEARA